MMLLYHKTASWYRKYFSNVTMSVIVCIWKRWNSMRNLMAIDANFWASLVENPWMIVVHILDILIVAYLIHRLIKALAGTKIMSLIQGVILLFFYDLWQSWLVLPQTSLMWFAWWLLTPWKWCDRITAIESEYRAFVFEPDKTPLLTRFLLWNLKSSVDSFLEKPLFGWGLPRCASVAGTAYKQGLITKRHMTTWVMLPNQFWMRWPNEALSA